jgi:hypothetical protein
VKPRYYPECSIAKLGTQILYTLMYKMTGTESDWFGLYLPGEMITK